MLFQGLSWLGGQWLSWLTPKPGCGCQDCVYCEASDAGGRQAGGRGWAGGLYLWNRFSVCGCADHTVLSPQSYHFM